MAGNVELRHHADAAVARVGHDVADLVLRVVEAVGALLVQLGEALALHAEALVVGEVPVEDVELHGGHGVEIALHHFERHPVARGIHHQAAPGKARLVFDVNGGDFEAIRAERDQLREGLEAVQRAGAGGRLERGALGGDVERVGFVFAERGIVVAGRRAFHAQLGRGVLQAEHGNAGLAGEPHHEAADGGFQAGVRRADERSLEGVVDRQFAGGGPHGGGQRHQRGRRRERRGEQGEG